LWMHQLIWHSAWRPHANRNRTVHMSDSPIFWCVPILPISDLRIGLTLICICKIYAWSAIGPIFFRTRCISQPCLFFQLWELRTVSSLRWQNWDSKVLTALSHGTASCQITVLTVHVVCTTARVISQPDTKVLYSQRFLLIHLSAAQNYPGTVPLMHMRGWREHCPSFTHLLPAAIEKDGIFSTCLSHGLAPWTTCTNLQQYWFFVFKYYVHKFGNTLRINGPIENMPPTRLEWRRHRKDKKCKQIRLLAVTSSSAVAEAAWCFVCVRWVFLP